jgi:hypothetical protein
MFRSSIVSSATLRVPHFLYLSLGVPHFLYLSVGVPHFLYLSLQRRHIPLLVLVSKKRRDVSVFNCLFRPQFVSHTKHRLSLSLSPSQNNHITASSSSCNTSVIFIRL